MGSLSQRLLIGVVALEAVIIAALVLLFFWSQAQSHDAEVKYHFECPRHLQSLGLMVEMERGFWGAFPSNLAFVANATTPNATHRRLHLHLLVCPGSNTKIGEAESALDWCDYTYINWSPWFAGTNPIPATYPMMYDRRLSNHDGFGVYVLMVNGTIIWDPGARWLREFGSRYPKYSLSLPD